MYLIYNNKQTLKLYINRIFKFNDITIINIQGGKKCYLGQKHYLTFLRLFLARN